MKLEHTTAVDGDTFEITDEHGNTVNLAPEEALAVCDWLDGKRGELTALINGLDASGREEIIRQIQYEQNERSITRSHFDSDATREDWNVDHPQ